MPRHVHRRAPLLVSAIVLGALTHPACAQAEVRVGGAPANVQLEARDASVAEVLDRLNQAFGLQYRSTASLDRRITGNYAGSLQHVVRRVLEGLDYVVKTEENERVEVVVIGQDRPGGRPLVAPAAIPAPAVAPPPMAPPTTAAAPNTPAPVPGRAKHRRR